MPSPIMLGDVNTATQCAAVTPHDSNDLSRIARALYVGVTGNVAVVCPGESTSVVFVGVPAGAILPVQARRVNATSTTASSIVALF